MRKAMDLWKLATCCAVCPGNGAISQKNLT